MIENAPMARSKKITLTRRPGFAVLALCAASMGLPAASADESQAAAAAPRVYTRAVVRDLPRADDRPALVQLKIVPRGQLPFTTLSFHVDDRRLLDGLAVGDEVGFIAERRSGGNTLTAVRKVAPCVRFQHCPEITD